VRTPTEAAWDSVDSHIGVAQKLQRGISNGIILDQYRNINNPRAHELTTGPEIIEAIVSTVSTPSRPSSEKLDAFIGGAGTGGTITGISRAIKKVPNTEETRNTTEPHNPKCIVVGVDPLGSILAVPDSLNTLYNGAPYVVEGIGYDFIPQVLSRDPEDIDIWLKTSDEDAWAAVRTLMRTEGLLVGGSSGSALSGALTWLKTTQEGKRIAGTEGANVVVLLPDGIRNYMSKPWFLEMTMEAKASPLAQIISKVLDPPLTADTQDLHNSICASNSLHIDEGSLQ